MKKTKKSAKKSNSQVVAKKSGVQPIGDRVLIRPDREEEKRIGAFIIPASGEKQAPDTGIVVAVGEGKYVDGKLVPIRIKAGDRVMFSKYGYDEVKVDGEDLYILKEEHILAVIHK